MTCCPTEPEEEESRTQKGHTLDDGQSLHKREGRKEEKERKGKERKGKERKRKEGRTKRSFLSELLFFVLEVYNSNTGRLRLPRCGKERTSSILN